MNKLKRFLALVLAMSMMLTAVPFGVFAAESDIGHMATKPADNTTSNEPFPRGTAGSSSFRIPALVTLSDGTLVAAADARWNTTYDGGGLDTIVSRSTDGGDNWSYTFANYLGDNGNKYNGSQSSCFIDPALAVTDDDTIYMLCDLYPYGIALNGEGNIAPSTATGFNANGYLALKDSIGYDGYYLKDGKIYNSSNQEQSGYTVDGHFNIFQNGTYVSNLFFMGAPFMVEETGFLYLTKSTNGGATWSVPQLLNLKTDSEQVCLVGPGRGLVTNNGTIVFPVYSFNGSESSQRMGFIYSMNNGASWSRVNSSISWSSESAVVELEDGTLRFFYRNGTSELCYVDYVWNSGWTGTKSTEIATNSNCQISAITLQDKVEGKQVILVSCPTGPNGNGSNQSGAAYRNNGKIFLFTVGANNALTKKGEVAVPSVHNTSANSFMYSCLTAQTDAQGDETGVISILYEDNESEWGDGTNCYYQMSYKEYDVEEAFGVTFSDVSTDEGDDETTTGTTVNVTLAVGATTNKTINGVSLNGSYSDDIASVTWVGSTYATATLGSNANYTGDTINVADCLYTFTKNDAGNWVINHGEIYLNTNGNTGFPHGTSSAAFTIEAGNEDGTFYIRSTSNNYLYFDRSAKNWNRVNSLNSNATWMANCSMSLFRVAQGEGSGEIYGYEKVTSVDAIAEGQYLIGAMASDNNWYIAYPSTDETTRYNQLAKVTGETDSTGEGTTVTVAKGQLLSDSSKVDISKCLFTFTDHAEEGYYVIESASVARKYLNNIMGDASATVPFSATAGKVSFAAAYTDMFQFTFNPVSDSTYGNGTGSAHLHFHTELQTPTWNRCGTDTSAKCYEYLYRAAKAGEESSAEIPGYVRVTSIDEIGPGQYLIAHTNGTNYYVLYPGSSQYGCVAQVVTETTTVYEDTTTVTIEGKAAGSTKATVGDTTYNITVTPDNVTNVENVVLNVGQTLEYTETSGAYSTATVNPDDKIVDMDLTPTAASSTKKLVEITDANYTFDANKKYLIVSTRAATAEPDYAVLTSDSYTSGNASWLGTLTGLAMNGDNTADSEELWTIAPSGNGYTISMDDSYVYVGSSAASMTAVETVMTMAYTANKGWTIYYNGYYLSDLAGTTLQGAFGWGAANDDGNYWTIYEVAEETTTASTKVSFTGKSAGTTTAVVGNTLYNITVSGTTVDIELEVGETFTYTDTTGVYGENDITEQPNGTYATVALTTTSNSVTKKLVQLTSSTFETGKRYVIENVRTANSAHAAYQPDHSVLTSDGEYGGLVMNGPLDVASSQTWTFTPSDNMYLITRNGQYINITDGGASMKSTSQELSLEYVDGSGWLIYYNVDGNNESNDGDFFLSDVRGVNAGEAYGYATKNDDGNYWNIYEVVEEENIDSTKVTFTGVAKGETTAVVGGTVYNITVVPAETDDEVMNSATNTWTVDAEVQWQRYNALTGLHKDLYTDASWKPYEAARQAAYKQLVTITNSSYATEAEASAELAKATELVNALQTAYNNLVSAKTISVRYKLGDTVLDTREYKIASTDTSLILPETIIVGDYIYEVTVDSLDLTGETGTGDTAYDVAVTLVGKVGGGFVGSQDIDLGYDHNNHIQVCDLVETDDAGTVTSRRKITEMTLTVGVSYDLDLATDTTDCTVEWSVEPTGVATVDQDGNVTAVAAGTTTLTAVIKDADGNVVEINSMPITVYPKGTGDRTTAMYIQEIDNTTVWCVVNGDTENRAFQVIEGELIYGQFDTTASDNSKTTAFSFFGDPDEAHALVYMKSTNSDDHYFLLHDDNGNLYDGTVTPNESYYVSGVTKGAGWWQAVGLNDNNQTNVAWRWQIVKDMVQWAILEGCDGGLGFTRRLSEGHMASNLTFASDPMPRIEKTVNGVLPTSRKQADFRRYTDGMVAAVHELVYFQITITQEVPTVWTDADETVGAITYSNAWVKDTVLPGAYLYTKELDNLDGTWDGEVAEAYRVQVEEITQKLNEAWTDEQKAAGVRTFPYYLLYEIQESDIPKFYIDNIAELSYGYKSHYSTGAQQGVADAEARISVVGTAIDDVVIDFGQSFVYEDHEYTSITDGKRYTFEGLTNTHLKGAYVEGENDIAGITVSKATAKYGTVKVYREPTGEIDDKGYPEYTYTVTYTPTQILQGVDTVQIYGYGDNYREKVINGFQVYPATTVYYEEGFILNNASTWSSTGSAKATVNQTFELLGDSQFNEHGELTGKVSNKKHAYGYDPIYNGDGTDDVAKSSITSSTIGDKTSFTFTGNGFEIFADCTTSSGAVSVQVQDASGKYVKIFNVNTVVAEENAKTGDATDGQDVPLNSLPIVSWHTDIHGTYTVTVTKVVDTKPVTIDGVRIFNTVNERKYDNDDGTPNSPFAIDLEDEPEFYQLRDYVLHAIDVDENTTEDYTHKDGIDRLTEQIMGQISTDSEAPTAVVLAGGKYDGDAQNLLDNGPKNELYLHTGETLVFKVSTKRAMQIGLKAPHASTTYSLEYKVGEGENAPTTTVASNQALNTSVDLFYELGNPMGNEQTYTVTITNNGNELLSVTDLKICDDPNAAFVALNAADIKTALTVMGYSETCEDNHSYEDGFCTVCGIGSARNITTGVEYGTVGEALAEAQDGETVKLLTDCTEGNFMVAPGITLDLNGFKLTASYAVAMDSAHIVDSVGGGCLVIGMKALVLDEENAMVPVYNGEGYIFTQVGFVIREDTTHTGEGFKIKAMAYPLQMDVVELLKDGCADNNIQIVVTLRWDTEDGVGSQSFTYNEEFVKTVYSSNKGSWSSYGKAFTMILTGYENIENLTGYIAVTSGTDVQYFCETGVDIT